MSSTPRFGSLFSSKILGGSVKKERDREGKERERDRERERERKRREGVLLHKEPTGCIS